MFLSNKCLTLRHNQTAKMTKTQKTKFNYDSPDGLPERNVWDSEAEDVDDFIEDEQD